MVIPPMKTHGTGVVKDPIEFACCAKQVLLVEAKIYKGSKHREQTNHHVAARRNGEAHTILQLPTVTYSAISDHERQV